MLGRVTPTESCRVFSHAPKEFYKIDPLNVDFVVQHKLAVANGMASDGLRLSEVEDNLRDVERIIKGSKDHQNLFNGPAIPICLSVPDGKGDLGTQLEDNWLPLLKKEYERQMPGTYFKATLQGNTELKQSVKVAEGSGYDVFLDGAANSAVVGYFFPTAFQEFDIKSQRSRFAQLIKPGDLQMCLSGPFEMIYSLIGHPKLLFSEDKYSPILCASALEHSDPRMVMMFKSYGPHLEFWLMTQMLTPTKTQVSEQWSGGITVFKSL